MNGDPSSPQALPSLHHPGIRGFGPKCGLLFTFFFEIMSVVGDGIFFRAWGERFGCVGLGLGTFWHFRCTAFGTN